MSSVYEHRYEPVSIYGNVVSLLRECGGRSGVHLDFGCGYGAIAEPIRDELGLAYLGFDIASDGLDSLRRRGFEAHRIDLYDLDQAETLAERAIGNRPIASMTCLDTLEHITNGEEVLKLLRRIAELADAPLVLSVPNVTHKDLALKLLIGRWDVTEAGLLDHTHVTLYSHARLSRLMMAVGWRQTAARDWLLQHSDQEFPASAAVLNHRLPIGHFLLDFINRANPHAIVNQFVRAYRVAPAQPQPLLESRDEAAAPFLSVVLTACEDTVAARQAILEDLARQNHQDFELVIGYPSTEDAAEVRDGLLARLPQSLCGRVRLAPASHAARADLLNAAVAHCAGRYFAILDDAGTLGPNWTASLAALGAESPGMVLQLDGSLPAVGPERLKATTFEAAVSPVPQLYRFASTEHQHFATLAIPTSVFHQLGLRFELEFPDGGGWDLAAEAILHCGLKISQAQGAGQSRERTGGATAVEDLFGLASISLLAKLNARPLLLPAGSAEQVKRLVEERLYFRSLAKQITGRPLLRGFIEQSIGQSSEWVSSPAEAEPAAGPFLSVITRTLGTRIHTLRDTLMSLAGQTCQDFELILVVHSTKETVLDTVRTLVAEFPSSFRQRVGVISCDRPGRSSPLNDGIRHAKGTYIVALDDDDIALGHWVESYRRLASESPGTLLRTTCTRQEFALGTADDVLPRWRAVSWFEMKWPAAYDAVAHLHTNYTPNMSVAFPAALFWEDGLCFDETMETAEDWDFMTRAAMLRGVASSPEVTSIYRWWINGESTLFTRTREQWEANARRIREKWNSRPLLLPRGSASRITSLIEEGSALRAQLGDLQFQHRHLEFQHRHLEFQHRHLEFQHRHLGQHARNLEEHRIDLERHIGSLESRIRHLEGEIHNHERYRLDLERYNRALEKHVLDLKESNNKMAEHRRELDRRNQYMSAELVRAGCWLPWADEDPRLVEVSREVLSGLLASTSWRSTRLFRRMVAFCSGRRGDDLTDDAIPSSFAERQRLIREIPRSTSWRIAFPVRIVGRMLQRSRTIAPQ